MSDLDPGEALGKKIGPLPVAGWLAAIGGGLGIAWYLRSKGINPDAADATDAGTYDPGAIGTSVTGGTGGAAVSDPYNPGNISDPAADPETAGSGVVPISTNGQWRTQAVKYLIGLGVSGTSAETAVGNYLAGRVLSTQQVTWINQALAGIGPTPAAVPVIKTTTGSTPTSGTPTSKPSNVPTTNAQWRPHAIYWLRVHGNYDKGMSTAAATSTIDTYLHGHALTYHQAQEIKRVNAGYRPPPHPLPIKLTAAAIHYMQTAHPDARRDTGADTNP